MNYTLVFTLRIWKKTKSCIHGKEPNSRQGTKLCSKCKKWSIVRFLYLEYGFRCFLLNVSCSFRYFSYSKCKNRTIKSSFFALFLYIEPFPIDSNRLESTGSIGSWILSRIIQWLFFYQFRQASALDLWLENPNKPCIVIFKKIECGKTQTNTKNSW